MYNGCHITSQFDEEDPIKSLYHQLSIRCVCVAENLQGHREVQWVQQLQEVQAHPNTREEEGGQEVSAQVAWRS